eukprot:scaffold72020_cov18-Prasinocladus_malaysianus.AAC.1
MFQLFELSYYRQPRGINRLACLSSTLLPSWPARGTDSPVAVRDPPALGGPSVLRSPLEAKARPTTPAD